MKISIKIKSQTSEEDLRHNCCSLNLFLVQLRSLLAALTKKKKGKVATEKRNEDGDTSPSDGSSSPTPGTTCPFFTMEAVAETPYT